MLQSAGLFIDPAEQSSQNTHNSSTLSHQSPGLKRLNFVRAYGTYYSAKIASIYGSSRKCMPTALRPGFHALEARVSTVASPLWWGMHIRSEQLLWSLDSKVHRTCQAPMQSCVLARLPGSVSFSLPAVHCAQT